MNIPLDYFLSILEQELGLDASSLSPRDELSSIANLDSMGRLSVITLCDSRFGFIMKVPELDACNTVSDLHAAVQTHATRQ